MSTQIHALPAAAGADIAAGLPSAAHAATLFGRIASHFQAWLDLRHQLGEVRALSNRELADIGLSEGEIERLRRGEVFEPTGWSKTDIARDQLPF